MSQLLLRWRAFRMAFNMLNFSCLTTILFFSCQRCQRVLPPRRGESEWPGCISDRRSQRFRVHVEKPLGILSNLVSVCPNAWRSRKGPLLVSPVLEPSALSALSALSQSRSLDGLDDQVNWQKVGSSGAGGAQSGQKATHRDAAGRAW